MSDSRPIDVLLVSPGTTAGWRRADGELVRALESLGLAVAVCTSDFRLARHLRRTVLLTDLAEAAAMRRAVTKALRRHRPRAIIYSSPQATMLQPRRRLEGATAVRFDAPAALNRPGTWNALLRVLERRGLRSVRMLLPSGAELHGRDGALPGVDTPTVALPLPLDSPPAPDRDAAEDERDAAEDERNALILAYAADPGKKGLDLIVAAWEMAGRPGRLAVTGIGAGRARSFLRRRGVEEPPGVEWPGLVAPERYRRLSRRARVLLSASRFEDYGLAQLEALADGALLVTAPTPGPYEALGIARKLGPRLVADDLSVESLGTALRAALALSGSERRAYRERARELLRPYTREAFTRRLKDDVLPVLLD